jgi:hypothetical protein
MTNASQITGAITVAAQGIYSESSTALHNIGEIVHSNDGRAFRYAKVGTTALVPGKLYQSPAEDTTNMQELTVTAPSAGDTSITTTSTVTLAVNAMAGGFLTIVSATTNAGQIMKIKGNTVASSAVTTIYLDDPVPYTPTGTVVIDMHPNPYNAVIVAPTTETSSAVGAALYKVTAAYYGWLQTHGPASLLAVGTITVGDDVVVAGATAAGGVSAASAATFSGTVGYALTGIADTAYGLVYLTID